MSGAVLGNGMSLDPVACTRVCREARHCVCACARATSIDPSQSFLPRRHWVNLIIKGPRIADVKHAGGFSTAQGVRHIGRETDVSLPAERGGGAIFSNIGKVPLDPDVDLITGMAVVGKREVGGKADEQFTPPAARSPRSLAIWTPGGIPSPLSGSQTTFCRSMIVCPVPKDSGCVFEPAFGRTPVCDAWQDQHQGGEKGQRLVIRIIEP